MITGGCRVKSRIDSTEQSAPPGPRHVGNRPPGGRNQFRPARPGRGPGHPGVDPSGSHRSKTDSSLVSCCAIAHPVRTSIVHVVAGEDKFAQDPEEFAGRLAAQAVSAGDPTGWFQRLYAAAEAGETAVPWGRGGPRPFLTQWAEQRGFAGARNLAGAPATRAPAAVAGSGLGEDAAIISGRRLQTVPLAIP